jgi:hypothetical protein
VRTSLIASLRGLGLGEPDVSISAVDHLPRRPDTGKLTRFIPLAGAG